MSEIAKDRLLGFLDIVKSSAVLAPLAGITDSSFRTVCRSFGAGFTVSEMVSAEGLIRRHDKTLALMRFTQAERPYGIQLFGGKPETLSQAVKIAAELSPDFIDLNCGCPSRKVVKHNSGAALMDDLGNLEAVLIAMRKAVKLPLSVKFRSGINPQEPVVIEAARIAEASGFDAVTVHPRHLKQGFKGKSDWSLIADVKDALGIPVIGNGDIKNVEDAGEMFRQTGCDLVMVGRAVYGNPWIFAQIAGEMDNPSLEIRLETIKKHYRILLERKGDYVGVNEMRKHLSWYSRGLPGSAEFRHKVMRMDSAEAVLQEIDSFFACNFAVSNSYKS